MSNKLRDVFNKNERILKASIQFIDADSSREFAKALSAVYKDGQAVKVKGVKSMSVSIDSGISSLPISNCESVTDVIVGPSFDEIKLSLDIDGETVVFPVIRCRIDNGCIVQTKEDFIICTKLTFNENTGTAKVSLKPCIERAKDIIDVLRSVKTEKAFLATFFAPDINTKSELDIAFRHLDEIYSVFEKLKYVADTFEKRFVPSSINLNDLSSQRDLYELWFALKEKKAIRLDARLVETSSTSITMGKNNPIVVNHKLDITMRSTVEYSLWGETIVLHCANYLGNAIVKSIERTEDGQLKVHYGEKESEPMYISYKGFLTEEEACEEHKTMMDHKEEYVNAKTVDQYMQEY